MFTNQFNYQSPNLITWHQKILPILNSIFNHQNKFHTQYKATGKLIFSLKISSHLKELIFRQNKSYACFWSTLKNIFLQWRLQSCNGPLIKYVYEIDPSKIVRSSKDPNGANIWILKFMLKYEQIYFEDF